VHVQLRQPALAHQLCDHFRSHGLISYVHREPNVVTVHDPDSHSDRETRLRVTGLLSIWTSNYPRSNAHLIDYHD